MNISDEFIYRLQGLGYVSDPNDFGQLLVCLIPLMFFFWRSKKVMANFALVILPVSILLIGVYLTHSRGALLAFIAVALLAARRRIGTVPALALAAVMFLGATALQFTGGRDISASAGEDRTALWGQGFAQLKEHPLFGVGFGQLGNYTEGNLTAHNTIVVCAAELGLFGLYFWSMFIFATLKDSITISTSQSKSQGVSSLAVDELYPSEEPKLEDTDDAEIRRLGNLVLLSITGFLTAGLFLSRAYVLTLYLLGGIAEVVFAMALQRGLVASRMPLARVMLYAAGLAALLVALMYVMIRVLNAVH